MAKDQLQQVSQAMFETLQGAKLSPREAVQCISWLTERLISEMHSSSND
jgi:hypothetical protein